MSNVVLTAAVRQNLLSLQSTAEMLSTTQGRLASGKKVNTALDNPTNFFTAAGLDARASDIGNLLDSIGNGVQVLQAANTGITSLQKLVDGAKSVANQALQAVVGYSTKSQVTSMAIAGATAEDLRGPLNYSSVDVTGGNTTNNLGAPVAITAATGLVSAATSDTLKATANGSMTVNGWTISFDNTSASNVNAINNTAKTIKIGVGTGSTSTMQNVIDAINTATGGNNASISSTGALTIATGTANDLNITAASGTFSGAAPGGFALSTGITPRTVNASMLDGLTLKIAATGNGTATDITFGDGTNGTVKSLNQLNAALASNNLLATLSADGRITISTTNDAASSTMGAITGTATTAGSGFAFDSTAIGAPTAPVQDVVALQARAALISQYNNYLDQITTTAQDASFNGINLLNGDMLKLTFNETAKSTLSIQGAILDSAGLGLTKLTAGEDFLDNSSASSVLAVLNRASSSLRSHASALGSNLSVVQIRQDFNKNLINVLQTGSANLTLADTNEEAANSQALSTRQSIAVSALALANQSQQSVLQLLR